MNRIAIVLFFGGFALIGLGILLGEGTIGIFLVFPYVAGSGIFMLVGILFILASFFVQFLSFFSVEGKPRRNEEKSRNVEGGAIIFIGPIPIVLGSNRMALMLLVIAMALLLIFLLLMLI